MSSKRKHIKRLYFLAALLFTFVAGYKEIIPAFAADLEDRSVRLSSSFAGEIVSHRFSFRLLDTSMIGSIAFDYCVNSPVHEDPCIPPAGLNTTSFTIASQSGITGFTNSGATTATRIVITRTPASQVSTNAIYNFSNITNPTTADEIVFVRMSVYDGTNATGTMVDRGSVAFAVEDRFNLDAYVPPYLTFCKGVTVTLNCSSSAGFIANFGELSKTSASVATTQFSASTNDINGYNVFISGQTMTSGTNIIPPLATQTVSVPGTSQFGINLRANTNPSVGSNPEIGLVASGVADSSYDVSNLFRFVNGERIAGSPDSTGFNKFTVSYLVNVSESQPPGVYATTLTYTAIASF